MLVYLRRFEDILIFGQKKWHENDISFHINKYIQQETKAIHDETAHILSKNIHDNE